MRREKLVFVIERAFQLKNYSFERKEAEDSADTLLAYFGYGSWCLSNSIDPDSLTVFYTMEDLGIVKPCSEEMGIFDGLQGGKSQLEARQKDWRIFQWTYDLAGIEKINAAEIRKADQLEQLYEELPEEAYARSQILFFQNGNRDPWKVPENIGKEKEKMVELELKGKISNDELRAMAEQGLTLKEIAEKSGIRYDSIWHRLNRMGIKARRKPAASRKIIVDSSQSPAEVEAIREPANNRLLASLAVTNEPEREKPLEFYIGLAERMERFLKHTASHSLLKFMEIEKKREDYSDQDIWKALEMGFRVGRIIVR